MRKNLFIICAVLAAVFTGCKDDEPVSLTGLTVNPATVSLPVGESAAVAAQLQPDNASVADLVWTSDNTAVATVTPSATNPKSAVIAVTGVGSTTVRVAAGGFTATVAVEGGYNSISVTAPADAVFEAGQSFQLTATTTPADPNAVFTWSSSDESVATVDASGTVTIVNRGTAVITASIGALSGTYTVIAINLFDQAIGYWEFDGADITTATVGDALTVGGDPSGITVVAGPSAANKAIAVTQKVAWLIAPLTNATANGHADATLVNQWSMMFDLRSKDGSGYIYSQAVESRPGDGDWFMRDRGGWLTLGKGNYPLIYRHDEATETDGWSPWLRVVVTWDYSTWRLYLNGAEISGEMPDGGVYPGTAGTTGAPDTDMRWALPPGGSVYMFAEDTVEDLIKSDTDDAGAGLEVSAIAIWNKTFTADEVAGLGGIDH
jgi:hypothetical protein